MAKLIFNNAGIAEANLIAGVKTDTDQSYILGDNIASCTVKDISDSDYDNVFNGTTSMVFANDDVTFADQVPQLDSESGPPWITLAQALTGENSNHKDKYNWFKKELEDRIAAKPNHSKIADANATLTFLNTLDADNLTEGCFKSMLDNNKYIEIRLF